MRQASSRRASGKRIGGAAAALALVAGGALAFTAFAPHPAAVSLASHTTHVARAHHTASTTGPASTAPASTALPDYGNPKGHAHVPPAGRPVSTKHPAHVIGHGTPGSCTSHAVVKAVNAGGVITFSCGPKPVTIKMNATAKVRNTSRRVVIDGGGKVTLSGQGRRRILYQDTCDPKRGWTTSHCQDQAHPLLIVQNLAFTKGNSTGQSYEGGGGGAIFDRGGQLRVVNDKFTWNRCDRTGPDLGGAAIRALSQYHGRPVYVVSSTFRHGVCSNGGALSSIGVSWRVLNDLMIGNKAVGWGANPHRQGTPGGGSGAAIYNDGDTYTVTVSGTDISGNRAREGGGAIFFVSNDRTGQLRIKHSKLHHNPNKGFQTAGFPGIFYLGKTKNPIVIDSTLN